MNGSSTFSLAGFIAIGISLTFAGDAKAEARTVRMTAADGVTVYGEVYTSPGVAKSAPLILLFHQGASNSRSEYEPLVPRLLDAGYNLLAIDQRRGGDRFGGVNRTLAGVGNTEYSYCDVIPDLEAALRFAREEGFDGPTAAWGSSYSAALIFRLAVDHPDEINAIVAFSAASGEPMEGCMPESVSGEVTQPVLALRPSREMQVPYVPGQMEIFEAQGHQTYIADPGVHGSSMLNEARVGASTAETWRVVLDFLEASLVHDD
jgi:alpha-beta hydrolase superfamily lysophospholipase